jgi:hypothetical protein
MNHSRLRKILPFIVVVLILSIFTQSGESLRAEVPEVEYKKALEYWKNGDYKESLEIIRKIIVGNMNSYKLRFLAAHNHWRLGNYE